MTNIANTTLKFYNSTMLQIFYSKIFFIKISIQKLFPTKFKYVCKVVHLKNGKHSVKQLNFRDFILLKQQNGSNSWSQNHNFVALKGIFCEIFLGTIKRHFPCFYCFILHFHANIYIIRTICLNIFDFSVVGLKNKEICIHHVYAEFYKYFWLIIKQ